MRFNRLFTTLFALSGAVLLMATPAGANSGHAFTFTASSYALNANANYTSTLTIGPHEVDHMSIDLEAGFKLAHDDQFGNELSSNPNDEESIGSGSAKASWWEFLQCDTHTKTLAVSWEESMTGAPAGAVAHYQVTASIDTYDVWAIEEDDATNDYRLDVDLDETWTCSSANQPNDASIDLTIQGTTAGGRKVSENPGTSGCYTVTAEFTEVVTPPASHSGTDSKAFGTGSCP
jgi:hypothetical protein